MTPDDDTTVSRFRELPEPVRLEDTVATHEADAPPDPDGGRDPNTEFMLRYLG